MRRAWRRHSRTEARTDEARFDSSVPVRIRVAVLKAARVFASDWAAGGGRWAVGGGRRACRRRHGALSSASGLPSAEARALRGGGVSTPRRLPGGPGVLSPWSPAWPSRHRMTSIHALGFLSGEFPARLRVYVCIDVHGAIAWDTQSSPRADVACPCLARSIAGRRGWAASHGKFLHVCTRDRAAFGGGTSCTDS
ncbi:hypothetical protein T210_0139575 [Burkholderia pseudomallei MSHR6137]|nr:hypothetical protein T210_0139575 [Burkholderia pseudomallei MSHR6137]